MRPATAALTAIALLLAGCGQGGEGGNAPVANTATNEAGIEGATLATLLADEPRFIALVRSAGMEPVLQGRAPYTLLVPTGRALDALPAGTLDRLQTPEARAELTALLRRHILPGAITAADLAKAVESGGGQTRVAGMAGEPLTVTSEGGTVRIGGAPLVGAEQRASNGVIHRIDAILPAPEPTTGSTTN